MLRVSDHALLRFLERGGGFDIEGLRAAVAVSLDRAAIAAARIGAGEYTIKADGLIYQVRDCVVTTVIDAGRRGAP